MKLSFIIWTICIREFRPSCIKSKYQQRKLNLVIRIKEQVREAAMVETILVVDNQTSVCQLLQEFLMKQGFRVITATDGKDALYKARQEMPALILLDIQMPEMDGYEFLHMYRRECQTPIILMTTREEGTDVALGLELGADDCLIKPFRMREMLARIHAILRGSGRNAKQPEILIG
jgi:two-component system, OmpR family, alkaline phosphatase synthesis response regulator PhoP